MKIFNLDMKVGQNMNYGYYESPIGKIKIEAEDEVLFAKSRDQVAEQLANLPKVQEKLLSILTNPEYVETSEREIDEYEGMSEDEFEASLEYGESEAEETSWEDV